MKTCTFYNNSNRNMAVFLLVILFSFNITFIQSARILAVFSIPSISHQIFYRQLILELVRRGHEVTVITTNPSFPKEKSPPNLREIDINKISYDIRRSFFKHDVAVQKTSVFKFAATLFKALVTTEEVQNLISKKYGEFDLILVQAIIPITLVFSHIFKVPVIQISSQGGLEFNLKTIGASSYPHLYPSSFSKKAYNLSTYDVFESIYDDWLIASYSHDMSEFDEILTEMLGSDVPPISVLSNNVHMLFLNVYPFWSNNQPFPPSVVQIGGLHKPPQGKLSKELQENLDSSQHGVIYFSFGTNVKTSLLSLEKIHMFIRVLSALPYDVILKWDQDTLPTESANIKIYKWLPQPELLKHPNVKLFITQGGIQSTDEAIAAGVPLIGIPMMTDQWYNTDNYVHHKIGVKLDLSSLTDDEFRSAIENVITDKSYRENIVRLRILMEDQPQSALERAMWWIEHVVRHGGAKHLRAAGANMSWIEYYELELLCLVVILILCILIFSYLMVYSLYKSLI